MFAFVCEAAVLSYQFKPLVKGAVHPLFTQTPVR